MLAEAVAEAATAEAATAEAAAEAAIGRLLKVGILCDFYSFGGQDAAGFRGAMTGFPKLAENRPLLAAAPPYLPRSVAGPRP